MPIYGKPVGANGVKPNWNQTDPSAPDYIKNKTHGYERIRELSDINTECTMLIESTELYDFGFNMGYKGTLMDLDGIFPENSDAILCRISCSDTNYTDKIFEMARFDIPYAIITENDTYGYGNPAFYTRQPTDDNGLPILIAKGDNDGEWIVRYYSSLSSLMGGIEVQIGTTGIFSEDTKIIQLDENYLPSTIPRTESANVGDVLRVKSVDASGKPIEWEAINNQSDWNQDNPNASDYIKNRPFGYDEDVETFERTVSITYTSDNQQTVTGQSQQGAFDTTAMDKLVVCDSSSGERWILNKYQVGAYIISEYSEYVYGAVGLITGDDKALDEKWCIYCISGTPTVLCNDVREDQVGISTTLSLYGLSTEPKKISADVLPAATSTTIGGGKAEPITGSVYNYSKISIYKGVLYSGLTLPTSDAVVGQIPVVVSSGNIVGYRLKSFGPAHADGSTSSSKMHDIYAEPYTTDMIYVIDTELTNVALLKLSLYDENRYHTVLDVSIDVPSTDELPLIIHIKRIVEGYASYDIYRNGSKTSHDFVKCSEKWGMARLIAYNASTKMVKVTAARYKN